MDSNVNLDRVLEILEERVLQCTGRYLTEAEIAVIKGSWDGKDYKEIARDSGYTMQYLQAGVGSPLWAMLSKVIGEGVQVKKLTLKPILLKVVKKDYFKKLKALNQNDDGLVGKTIIYGELPKVGLFYGREKDIKDLKYQVNILKQTCIAITGVGGVGKSFLIAKLIEEMLLEKPDNYEYIIWNTLTRYSSVDEIVAKLIKNFNLNGESKNFNEKISLLSNHLNTHRCLIVLDGFENIANVKNFEQKLESEDFFIGLTREPHQSSIIVTSQVPLEEITYVTKKFSFLSLRLEGLDERAAIQMLYEKGLSGEECKELVETYRGNPSELEVVTDRIHRFFGGSIKNFFKYKSTVIGPRLQAMLNQQFGQAGFLNNLQKQIMIYLAEEISKDSSFIPFSKLVDGLKERLNSELSISELIMALEVLEQRSLVETSKKFSKQEASYSLEPVVKKYILADPLGLVYEQSSKTKISNSSY